MKSRTIAIVTLTLLLTVFLTALAVPDECEAVSEDDVTIISQDFDKPIDVRAGSSKEISAFFYTTVGDRLVYVSYSASTPDIKVSLTCRETGSSTTTNNMLFLSSSSESSASGECHISIVVDQYARSGEESLNLEYKIINPADGSEYTKKQTLVIDVNSSLSSGNAYNKIMGIWDNTFPAPFSGPVTSAIITMIVWIVIGIISTIMIVPLILKITLKKNETEIKEILMGIRKLIFIIILAFGVTQTLKVLGASEIIIGTATAIFGVVTIVLGSLIVWNVYVVAIKFFLHKMSENRESYGVDNSLIPLFKMIGKILIGITAVASIMATLGFNLYAIIAGAGIVGLAISLGAQNMLNQFFSGLTLLITRPFKSNDLIRLGENTEVLRVRRVGIMTTTFENWTNAEVFSLPNNMVTGGKIVNITGENRAYRILLLMTVAYGSDLKLAKQIMLDAAMNHPQVYTDGRFQMPLVRVEAMNESDITIRLTAYVKDFEDAGTHAGTLRETIYEEFVKQGIHVPFPQLDVHIHNN